MPEEQVCLIQCIKINGTLTNPPNTNSVYKMRDFTKSRLSSIKNPAPVNYPFQNQKQSQYSSLNYQTQIDYLFSVLTDLDGIEQDPRYHPEIDALYHSLQVFQQAKKETEQPILLAAALFHDIGKSVEMHDHAMIGAQMLNNILCEPIIWLIAHHLDLLLHPKRTRNKLKNTPQLKMLEMLRRWDLQGRETQVHVLSIPQAIKIITRTDEIFQLKINEKK